MSNPSIFKSSENSVERVSTSFRSIGAASNTVSLSKGSTNLTVIGNMINANAELNSCHTDFIQLLMDDADSVEQVKQAFDEFDQKEADMM